MQKKTKSRIPHKTEPITRDFIRTLSDEVIEELKELANSYNLQVGYRGASFSPTNVTIKVEFATICSDGQAKTKEVSDFEFAACRYGLKPTDIGRKFVGSNGETYKLTGLSTRAHRYPLHAIRIRDGKRFKFPPSLVIANFIK
jgi:hypothetical protein